MTYACKFTPNTLLDHPHAIDASLKHLASTPYVPHVLCREISSKANAGFRCLTHLFIARPQEIACLSALFLALVVDCLDCSYLQPVDSLQKLLDFDLDHE